MEGLKIKSQQKASSKTAFILSIFPSLNLPCMIM